MGFAARGAARALSATLLAGVLGGALLSTASADEASVIAGTPVGVGQGSCGSGWSGGDAGPLTFALTNGSSAIQEVQIQDTTSKRIFVDVEDLGIGATRSVALALAAGRYRFLCLAADGAPSASPAWQLTGDYSGATTPGALPATANDFVRAVDTYSAWTQGQLIHLGADVATLRAAVAAGNLVGARRAYRVAHRQYLLLGAAYGAFGDAGTAIDPQLTAGVTPLRDPELTGFPKLEAVLWHARPVARVKPAERTRMSRHRALRSTRRAQRRLTAYLRRNATPVATRLAGDVAALTRTFNHPVQPANIDMGLRSHEILEDALRSELLGRNDAGAHLTLFDIDAMIDATRDVIAPLRGLLATRDADLATTDAWLARLQAYVDAFHHTATDSWTPYQRLSSAQRRRLQATLSQTLEYLSEIAVVLDPVQAGPA